MLLALALAGGLNAQEEHKGSNYDPPPKAAVKKEELPPPPPPEEPPIFQLPSIDWGDKNTYLKIALLVGSILLARRAFRQMRGDS